MSGDEHPSGLRDAIAKGLSDYVDEASFDPAVVTYTRAFYVERAVVAWLSVVSEEERAAADRLAMFCDEYGSMSGMDPENVYRLHLGSERECGVTISDLRLLIAAAARRLLVPRIESDENGGTK